MKKFVFAAALGLLLSGCGAYLSPAAPSHSPAGGFDVVATDTDHDVTIRTGQTLEVVLHAPNGMSNWTHPQSSDTSVLGPIVDPAATAARGVTLAAYKAMKPGRADVTANASPMCSPGAACPMYIAVYSLKVTVTQ